MEEPDILLYHKQHRLQGPDPIRSAFEKTLKVSRRALASLFRAKGGKPSDELILQRRLDEGAISAALPAQSRIFGAGNMVVLVIGCGNHGCNIAGELLRRGCHVCLYDKTILARHRAIETISAGTNK